MDQSTLKKIFNDKREKIDKKSGKVVGGFKTTTFNQFLTWFNEENFKNGCHYCGTTNAQSYELYQRQRTGQRPDATRGGKRSKRLEIDRRDPFLSYDNLNNIVWCCYWCNNAKSNFFTEEEFLPIAAAIGVAIKKLG